MNEEGSKKGLNWSDGRENESTEQLFEIQQNEIWVRMKEVIDVSAAEKEKKETNERYPDWFSFLSGFLKLACAENKKKNGKEKCYFKKKKLMKLLRFDESFWRACSVLEKKNENWKEKNEWCLL